MTQNEQLIAEYLARGGVVKKLPEKRVARDLLTPDSHKRRDILADLAERARSVRS